MNTEIKDLLRILVVTIIPTINIIMWFKWLISKNTNLNLKNYLISILIITMLWFFLWFGILGILMMIDLY
ncbi:hypothetical protein FV113G1_P20560 (plasmid) [Fusobacterium varium]|uniref:hypothetical protein n=1 Tax=Fusobacterium varium TaxID=856 RepID=UPI000BBB3C5E|nr:hypothetical protein [Fusobacterium varium]MCF0169146.1 hypothetical protein [Fusobacterium varium]BBA53333.1 hypothetical protein FV113G1_P20560 [Fusobacterium varium]